MKSFFGQSRQQIGEYLKQNGISITHVKPIMKAFYFFAEEDSLASTAVPRVFRARILKDYSFALPEAIRSKVSNYDGSAKFELELSDGSRIETVIMPEKNRITLCVSSQVGCAQGCVFCHTGKMGLARNLKAHEIVTQIVFANMWLLRHPDWLTKLNYTSGSSVSNVVFMGMGEPCDNSSEVAKAIEILTDPWGLSLAPSKVTVSTAGHLDGLKIIYNKLPQVNYALSLHSTSNGERSRLMPINKRFPIEEVLQYFRDLSDGNKKNFLIQYTVIDRVNDDEQSAKSLASLVEGIRCKINLIPLNPIEPSRLNSPLPERLIAFRDELTRQGLRVMIRYSKGQDIDAACGQLVALGTSKTTL